MWPHTSQNGASPIISASAASIAAGLGGRPVDPNTTDPHERRLLNVVEEMAIASGTPVPAVHLLPGEPGINAFAMGLRPADSGIAVTDGCLKLLTRDDNLRAAMGRNGIDYVAQNYRWDVVLAKYERLFAKIRNAR